MRHKESARYLIENFSIPDFEELNRLTKDGPLNEYPCSLFRFELYEAKLLLGVTMSHSGETSAFSPGVLREILGFCLKFHDRFQDIDAAFDQYGYRTLIGELFVETECDECKKSRNTINLDNVSIEMSCSHNRLVAVGSNLTTKAFVRRHAILAAESILLIDRAISAIHASNIAASTELTLAVKEVLGHASDVFTSSDISEAQRLKQMLSEERRKNGAKGGAAANERFIPLKAVVKRMNDERVLAGDPFRSARQLAIAALDEILAESEKRGVGMSMGNPLKRVEEWAREIWTKSH